MTTEFEFIDRIRRKVSQRFDRDLIVGIGDDAAVLREQEGRETLVTVDLLVEAIDFKLDYMPPRLLGHKSLAVSLSDIAAMGGVPRFSLLTLGIPKSDQQTESFWEEFFDGYISVAEKYGVRLIGGDISSVGRGGLTLDSIVIGHCRAGRSVRRSGARPGDAIFLTGAIGASLTGLRMLLGGARIDEGEDGLLERALRSHLSPAPPVEFGRRIGEAGIVRAMIDLSDGLTQDLDHICQQSSVGAIIDFERVPLAAELKLIAPEPRAAFDAAIGGGEDFELLLTAPPSDEDRLMKIAEQSRTRLSRIGEIIERDHSSAGPVLLLREEEKLEPLPVSGYDHFSNNPII